MRTTTDISLRQENRELNPYNKSSILQGPQLLPILQKRDSQRRDLRRTPFEKALRLPQQLQLTATRNRHNSEI